MNAQASVASENWERLLIGIQERGGCVNTVEVELADSEADLYDFANEVLMRRMRERLVEALQNSSLNVTHQPLAKFGNKNYQQQRSFFHSIFNLPCSSIEVGEATDNSTEGPAITINTSALLETLPQLHTFVSSLKISNFALTCRSDVQTMSNIIRAKSQTLWWLGLESIKSPVDDCIKQDRDELNGFFDPLLHAASGLDAFSLSAKPRTVHSTLVSPMAVGALFVEETNVTLRSLHGLGLTDSHVLAIVDGLSTPGAHLHYLNLVSNPGITAQGYDALLNLINRDNVVGSYVLGFWIPFCVDDKAWEGKLNLVSEMNSQYGRLEYLTNGSFSSEKRRWQWLERVVDLPSQFRKMPVSETKYRKIDGMEIDDAKHVDFIWHILRENPEMTRT